MFSGAEAKRVHDEEIYLVEDRTKQPKENFKVFGEILSGLTLPKDAKVLDVGCATGELVDYLRSLYPDWRYHGLDVSQALIDAAAQRMPDAVWRTGSILDPAAFRGGEYDLITCSGVLTIFDEIEAPIANLLSGLKPGGALIIFTPVNEYGCDVLVRVRRVDRADDPWHSGFNQFSREYFERVLTAHTPKLEWRFRKFTMPIPLERRHDDPLRNWTTTLDGENVQMRGTSQVANQFFLTISRPS
jgi:SAM-dependent methyltransferase